MGKSQKQGRGTAAKAARLKGEAASTKVKIAGRDRRLYEDRNARAR